MQKRIHLINRKTDGVWCGQKRVAASVQTLTQVSCVACREAFAAFLRSLPDVDAATAAAVRVAIDGEKGGR